MTTSDATAVISRETVTYQARHTLADRVQWRVDLPTGGRKIAATRKEAVAWCDERDLPYEFAR